MAWKYAHPSFVWVFPVGRGNHAFQRTGLNHGFVLDIMSEYEFDISKSIKRWFVPDLTKHPDTNGQKIAQAVLSHSILFPGDMTPEGMKLLLADRAEKRFTWF